MLGRLLWKPTPTGGPLHSHTGRSQWRKTNIFKKRKRKERSRESTDWGREREGGREKTHKHIPQSKLQKVRVSIAKAREGKSPRESEAAQIEAEAALPYINFCQYTTCTIS